MNIILSEGKNVFLGNDILSSFGIWIRNSDVHLIYSSETMKRKNQSKSIFVGDHVWLGQYSMLLKCTQIASGSIIGAKSLLAGKKISSNTIWAGNPAKLVSTNIFWDRPSNHNFKVEDTKKHEFFPDDRYIFKHDKKVYIPFDEIDNQLTLCKMADEKLAYLQTISGTDAHNRFAF